MTPRPAAPLLLVGALLVPRVHAQDDWSSLDHQIASLTARAAEDGAVSFGGLLQLEFSSSDDAPFGDLGDLGIGKAGLSVTAERGAWDARLGYDPVTARLRNTWVRLRPAPPLRLTLGHYKAPLLRSRRVSRTRLLFTERTAQARQTGPREAGVLLEVEPRKGVRVLLSAQDGADGPGDGHYLVGRVEVDLLGGGVGEAEGAHGAGPDAALTVGLGVAKDQTLADGRFDAIDLALTAGRFSLAGEVLSYPGDPGGTYDLGILDPVSSIPWTDSEPYDLTLGYLVLPDELEVALRLEELDDPAHTARLGLGLDRYLDGHALKWQVSLYRVESDLAALESELLVVGFTLRF